MEKSDNEEITGSMESVRIVGSLGWAGYVGARGSFVAGDGHEGAGGFGAVGSLV